MPEVVLGHLSTVEPVYDREAPSHVHAGARELLPEALGKCEAIGDFMTQTVDLGREVGYYSCVETRADDTIVYAQRVGREGLTRFVQNREPLPCSLLTFVLEKQKGRWVCLTAYIGELSPPEPWGKRADHTSLPYWRTHALFREGAEIIEGTEQEEYPW